MDYGTYVSCIKIGKQPIISPLLSEECRNEMRYYRDLAISLEKRRKCRRSSADSGVMISSNDGSSLRKANTSEVVANEPLAADTSKDMVSADGSSSNETMVSAEGSPGDSDHDNVFFEAEKTCSPLRERRNSYTIQRNPDNETPTQAVAVEHSPKTAPITASERSSTPGERRNSFIVDESPNSTSESSKIIQRKRRNSFIVDESPKSASSSKIIQRERRNSFIVDESPNNASESSKKIQRERRNSFIVDESPNSASSSKVIQGERRNSFIVDESPNSASESSKIIQRERRNSYTIDNSSSTASASRDVPVPRERRNSYTIDNSSSTASASRDVPDPRERRNSYTIDNSSSTASASKDVPVPHERRNSYTIENSSTTASAIGDVPVPRERRNSYTVQDPHISGSESPKLPAPCERRDSSTLDAVTPVPTDNERRNSYTLESPSPVMLQYIQSLELHDANKQCELFVESLPNLQAPDVFEDHESGIEEKELSLEDLVNDSIESDLKLSELGMWDACSDETLHNFLKLDLEPAESLPSSICGSPVSVIPAGNLSEHSKNSADQVFDAPAVPANLSCDCICNVVSNFEPLIFEVADAISPRKDFDDRVNDSFSRDFRYLDLSNFSCDSDCPEGGYSECSSVSLSKFLSGDKLPDGAEAEYVAFAYMKEQLEQKHRDEFKRLLREQQREHDNLMAQFTKVSSLSKHTPSPKSSYAYSGSVLLKKYTPTSGRSTPTSKSVDERRTSGSCGRSDGFDGSSGSSNAVQVEKKTSATKGRSPRRLPSVEQAASKINAAVRGYLTRRLLKTERITHLVQTIKDCLATALSLQSEPNLGLSELDLQSRLLQQLTVACNDLHSTFSLPVPEKMAIIAADREKKFRLSLKRRTPLPLSEATRRTLQRRNLIHSDPPAQRKYDRRRCKSVSSTTSETNSCRSTPGSRRLVNTIWSRNSDSLGGRPPWR